MKIVIDVPTFIELNAAIADWYVEQNFDFLLAPPWVKDEDGNESYTEEAQDMFNSTYGEIEEILSKLFIKEGE